MDIQSLIPISQGVVVSILYRKCNFGIDRTKTGMEWIAYGIYSIPVFIMKEVVK